MSRRISEISSKSRVLRLMLISAAATSTTHAFPLHHTYTITTTNRISNVIPSSPIITYSYSRSQSLYWMSTTSNDTDEQLLEEVTQEATAMMLCPYYTYTSTTLSSAIATALETNSKKQASLLNEQSKAEECEAVQYRANLILSNLWQIPPGTRQITVTDWESPGQEDVELTLDVDKYNTPNEEADALFLQARKMKRGSSVVAELIAKNLKYREYLEKMERELAMFQRDFEESGRLRLTEMEEVSLLSIWQRLHGASKKTGMKVSNPLTIEEFAEEREKLEESSSSKGGQGNAKKRPKNKTAPDGTTFRFFDSPSGLKVVVGRNRRDNEAICFRVARGEDIWMHARGCPGAHVLIKVRRGSTKPTDEDLQFCANLAAFYSEARTERKAVVTLAEPKHIQKPRGAPLGAVKLRHELGSMIGLPHDVAEELKLAREESGFGSDESGRRSHGGKAKGKKRYELNLKQQQDKQREAKRKKKENKQRGDLEFYNDD